MRFWVTGVLVLTASGVLGEPASAQDAEELGGEYEQHWEKYRGPLELDLYTGWNLYDSEMDLETGGSLNVGSRLTINFWDRSPIGVHVGGNVTRINVDFSNRSIEGANVTAKDEVTISELTAGVTLRLPWWYVQPFVRVSGGLVILDDIETQGVVNGAFGEVEVDRAVGVAGKVDAGLDVRLSKHWTLRVSGGVALYEVEWPDDDEQYQLGSLFQAGFVWHFDD